MLKIKLALLLAAGTSCVTFLVRSPSPSSAEFWLITAPGIACVIAISLLERRAKERAIAKFKRWEARMHELVDIHDVEDDGHLEECFSDSEWDDIFRDLEGQSKGSRSLRRAIEAVFPDFKFEN